MVSSDCLARQNFQRPMSTRHDYKFASTRETQKQILRVGDPWLKKSTGRGRPKAERAGDKGLAARSQKRNSHAIAPRRVAASSDRRRIKMLLLITTPSSPPFGPVILVLQPAQAHAAIEAALLCIPALPHEPLRHSAS